MQLAIDWRKLSPEERFRHAFKQGYVFFLGYWTGEEINEGRLAFDGKRWVTMHPRGKGPKADGSGIKKGRHVQIESTTGEILKGPFNGQKITELSKNNKTAQNEVGPEQAQRSKQAPTSAKLAQTTQTQQQERDAALAGMKAQLQELSQGPQTQLNQDAQTVLRKLIHEPLDKAGSSQAAQIAWLKSLAPKVHVDGLFYLKGEELHDVLSGVERALQVFPSLANNIHGFTNIGLKEAQYQKEYAQYSPYLERAKAAIRADKAKMQQLTAQVKSQIWRGLITILQGNDKIKPEYLRYENKNLMLEPNVKKQVFNILRQRQINQLSQSERKSLANVFIRAAQDIAIKNTAQYELALKGYPAPEEPDDLTLIKHKNGIGHAGAAFNPVTNEIWLSQHFLGLSAKSDLNKNYRVAIKEREYHPELKNWVNGTTAMIIHEMAHCLDNLLRQESRYFRAESDKVIIKAYNQYLTDQRITDPTDGPYAARNQHEFFAEQVTEALTAPMPSPRAKAMFAYAKELHRKYLRG